MTHYCVTLGGANYKRRDTVGLALDRYASRGKIRRVVGYSQEQNSASFAEGLRLLHEIVPDILGGGDTCELMGGSMGAEIIGEYLYDIENDPHRPTPDQITHITLIGNPARALGGVYKGLLERFGYQPGGRRRVFPVTDIPTDDIARVKDGWANNDRWAEQGLKKPTALQSLAGRVIDHSNYDDVTIATSKLRAVVGATRYWVSP